MFDEVIESMISEFDIPVIEAPIDGFQRSLALTSVEYAYIGDDILIDSVKMSIVYLDFIKKYNDIYTMYMLHELGHVVGINILIHNKRVPIDVSLREVTHSVNDFFGKDVPVYELKRIMDEHNRRSLEFAKILQKDLNNNQIRMEGDKWNNSPVELCAVFFQYTLMFTDFVRENAPKCYDVFRKQAKKGRYGTTIKALFSRGRYVLITG